MTESDRESEEAIISLISEHRPEDGIIAEEGSSKESETGRRWETPNLRTWLLDC